MKKLLFSLCILFSLNFSLQASDEPGNRSFSTFYLIRQIYHNPLVLDPLYWVGRLYQGFQRQQNIRLLDAPRVISGGTSAAIHAVLQGVDATGPAFEATIEDKSASFVRGIYSGGVRAAVHPFLSLWDQCVANSAKFGRITGASLGALVSVSCVRWLSQPWFCEDVGRNSDLLVRIFSSSRFFSSRNIMPASLKQLLQCEEIKAQHFKSPAHIGQILKVIRSHRNRNWMLISGASLDSGNKKEFAALCKNFINSVPSGVIVVSGLSGAKVKQRSFLNGLFEFELEANPKVEIVWCCD